MSRNYLDKWFKIATVFVLLFSFCSCYFATVYVAEPITQFDSPLRCGPDQYYDNCASPCPATCANLRDPPFCPPACVPGCTCVNRGHVYDAVSGRCVPPRFCPDTPERCRANLTYHAGNFNGPTCDGVVIAHEKPGCSCGGGFVRNRLDDKCVLPKDCPKYPHDQVCPNNEYVSNCINPCAATCKNPVERQCPTYQCVYGCACKRGLVRDESTGKCVELKQCPGHILPPVLKCNENEVFQQCGSACPPTCLWPNRTCKSPCVRGCFCQKGFIRVSEDGECVPEWVCSYIRA